MNEYEMEPEWSQNDQEDLYHLMRACGHILYHSGSSKTGQGRILHLLDQNGPVSQKDLQTTLDIQSGSISEILTKLEREGLIRRQKDENDRRRIIVSMTEKGTRHAQEYHQSYQEKDWFAALDPKQRGLLRSLLQTLLNSWREPET